MPVIIVHRAHCGLRERQTGRSVLSWCEYRFLPIPPAESGSPQFVVSRAASVPLLVMAPPGTRVRAGLGAAEDAEPLLTTVDNPTYGFDATAVWGHATKGTRGFSVRPPGA